MMSNPGGMDAAMEEMLRGMDMSAGQNMAQGAAVAGGGHAPMPKR